MVMPLYDDNTDRQRQPVVNYLFIIANVIVFVFFQGMGSDLNRFTRAFALVPEEILTGEDIVTPPREVEHPITKQRIELPGLEPTPISVYLTFLTSIFMHGGWMHLFGNMLFLWIFGDNVEDDLGHVRYLLFYLITGILATVAHITVTVAMGVNQDIPTLGASGAISGVLGGYLLLHPHRRVTVLMFRFLTQVPGYVAIGLWFLFQLIHGLGALGESGGGVAYGAHIGGFIAGLVLIKVFMIGVDVPRPKPRVVRNDWR